MATVPTQEDFRDYLKGDATPVVSLSGAGAAPVQSTSPQQNAGPADVAAPSSSSVTTQTAPSAGTGVGESAAPPALAFDPIQGFGQSGNLQQRLTDPLSGGIQSTSQGISQASRQFQQAAGPTGQTYEGRGGDTVVDRYLRGDFSNSGEATEARTGAKGLVDARYTGPETLDQNTASQARLRADEIQKRASSLRGGAGVQASLQEGIPGLTSGQARFEAERMLARPEFRQKARTHERDAGALLGQLAQAEEAAKALALQRSNEEQAISERAREGVLGKRTAIEEDVNKTLREAVERERATEEAYINFLETGDPMALMSTEARDFDPAVLNTPAAQMADRAREEYARIMEKYGGLSDYDPLGLSVSKRGREVYSLGREGSETWDKNRPDWIHYAQKNQDINKDQRAKLEARQAEFEALFNPGRKGNQEIGDMAVVAPLYYGGGDSFEENIYKPADARSFTEYVPGVRPAVENVSTAEQKQVYNRINDLLDEAQRIEEAGEPYRASMITADVDRYLSEEEAALEERAGQLDERSTQWQKLVNKARKKYRKSKSFGKFAEPLRKITGSDTLGNALGTIAHGTTSGDFGEAAKGGFALPFAMGTYPATGAFNPLSSTGDEMATSMSPAKAPRDFTPTVESRETYRGQASPLRAPPERSPLEQQVDRLTDRPQAASLDGYIPMTLEEARAARQAEQANLIGAGQILPDRKKQEELVYR